MNFKQLIMERDGTTPCFVRLLTFASVLGFVGLTAWDVARGQAVDLVQWATGMTMLTAGGAGAARVKLDTEATAS